MQFLVTRSGERSVTVVGEVITTTLLIGETLGGVSKSLVSSAKYRKPVLQTSTVMLRAVPGRPGAGAPVSGVAEAKLSDVIGLAEPRTSNSLATPTCWPWAESLPGQA